MEADTAAYSGQLREAREFSRRAMDSAERAGEKEAAATYVAHVALREALFGNADEAQGMRRLALGAFDWPRCAVWQRHSPWRLQGMIGGAQSIHRRFGQRFPEDTIVQFNYLPTLRAQLALTANDVSRPSSVSEPQRRMNWEIAVGTTVGPPCIPFMCAAKRIWPAHQGSEAAAEFQKILDHRGIVLNEPIGALAHLQIGRAYAMQGDTAKANAAYQDFLTLWKDADPDIPILKQAKAEYARLQ